MLAGIPRYQRSLRHSGSEIVMEEVQQDGPKRKYFGALEGLIRFYIISNQNKGKVVEGGENGFRTTSGVASVTCAI